MDSDSPASSWGRIDDDGTVYVRTADGERVVGSWQAGDSAEGLAYYQRRYADLATEVELLETRLASGAGDAKATWNQAAALQDSLVDASVVGDLDALRVRLTTLRASAEAKMAEQVLAKEKSRTDAVAAKEALIVEAEQIAEKGTAWKSSGDRMRVIVDEWKQIKGIDRKTDDALWKRYAAARDAFGRRRGSHFAALDTERGEAKAAKEALVAKAAELSSSDDWRTTASAMKDLMSEWKASGRASRGDEDALWKQFRAAQDAFFARRSEVFAERDAGETENQKKKEDVITEAESLDLSNPKRAQTQLREIIERYEKAGRVPRDSMRRLEDRMHAAEQRVRDAVDSEWKQASIESNPFLAELRARLAEAEEKLERAKAGGDPARIAKVEAEVQQRRALIPDV
ncbi:MAG: DUF349 domain-containing protein [Jatrophihabitans sp.]